MSEFQVIVLVLVILFIWHNVNEANKKADSKKHREPLERGPDSFQDDDDGE